MLDETKTADMPHVEGAPTSEARDVAPTFDHVVGLAADLLDVPFAVLSLHGRGGASLTAQVGLDPDVTLASERPGAGLVPEAEPCVVPDASLDPRFSDHPLVRSEPFVRFFAGVPLLSAEGAVLGTLCAMDCAPRPPPPFRDIGRLQALAALAVDEIQSRHHDRAALADAEATATARSDLLADVSHEMRTPLNGIVGFTTLLKRDAALDPDALRTVERIEDAGRGLLSIVEDALDLSKFESGTVRLDVRPFSPSRLVEDAVALVRPDADRKGLGLILDLSGAPAGPLLGDLDRLRQVLLNLLSNAVKFTEAGAVRVSLAGAPEAEGVHPHDASVKLSIAVADSGIGLDRDSIPRLFRRFAQADGTVSRRLGGSGLGLAISKTIVDAMGGSIAVESAPGAGSRFTVSLSLPPAAVAQAPARRPRGVVHDGLRGLAILLAEDVPLNQKLVVQMLSPHGAEVDVVGDGAAALAAVRRRDYALVLMDMEMPVLGGLDATRRIRALGGAFADLPIVALTANVFPEQLDLCREAGMDDHLTKPFGPDDLAAAVLRWATPPGASLRPRRRV